MARLVDRDGQPGAVVINHTHNQRQWSPSHGQPLPPSGYAELFETLPVRLFGEAGLLADLVRAGPLDLSRRDSAERLERDPALTIIASRQPDVFTPCRLEPPPGVRGELRLNPLYAVRTDGRRG